MNPRRKSVFAESAFDSDRRDFDPHGARWNCDEISCLPSGRRFAGYLFDGCPFYFDSGQQDA